MTEEFKVEDVECAVLNEAYIQRHYRTERPSLSPELKAQILLDSRGNFRRVLGCPKFDASTNPDRHCMCRDNGCIYEK